MRAVTLKAAGDGVAQLIGYYAGLARDRLRRDGVARGPVDYYLDPAEPPGRWGGSGLSAVGLDGEVLPEQLQSLLEGRHPATGATLGRRFGTGRPGGSTPRSRRPSRCPCCGRSAPTPGCTPRWPRRMTPPSTRRWVGWNATVR
jgi:hypothetical protein